MTLIKKILNINDTWFYSEPPLFLKLLTIFVWGDALVILPWIALCALIMVANLKIGLLLLLTSFTLRFFGEVIYWLHQQFGPRTYRPYDYGLKHLSNNSIYIIYQLTSTFTASLLALATLLIFKT